MTRSSITIRIHGMDCAEEVGILRREICPLVGGDENLAFDILNGRMTVAGTAGDLRMDDILARINSTGMRGEVWQEKGTPAERSWWDVHGRLTLTISSGLLALAAFLGHLYQAGSLSEILGSEGLGIRHEIPLTVRLFYGLSILCGGWFILPKAGYSLRRGRPDMNLLMTIAVIGAAIIGEWFEAASVSFLFALSLTLESWSVGRARRAVESLLSLTPSSVRLMESGGLTREVAPEDVPVGSLFLVKPGERIALDGEVVSGNSHVNQAPITGESVPVEKTAGSAVYAGTVNGQGALEVRSTRPAGDTTLAHIIRMVGEAQHRRAPSEQWVDGFARIYTPAVMALAICVFLGPPLLWDQPFNDWIYRSLVLLVIACPCALVISTPVSIVAALTAAARQGVLIKGGQFVEAPAHLRVLAFDKTGTLTEGRLKLAEIVPLNGYSENRVLEVASALESQSGHPLAHAVLEYARERNVKPLEVRDLQNLTGQGVTARIDGMSYWVGSHRYLEERAQETNELHERLTRIAEQGKTVVLVGNDHQVMGLLALADRVRSETPTVIHELRACGVEHIVMLTGDNEPTALAIAR